MLENTVVSHEHAEQVESSEQTSSVSKAEDESQRQPVLCQGKGVTGEIKWDFIWKSSSEVFFPLDEWNAQAFGVVGILKKSRNKERQIGVGEGDKQTLIVVQNKYHDGGIIDLTLVYQSFVICQYNYIIIVMLFNNSWGSTVYSNLVETSE